MCYDDPERDGIFEPSATPIDDAEEFVGGPIICDECNTRIEMEAYYDDGISGYYCERCVHKLIKGWAKEARQFAEKNCHITSAPYSSTELADGGDWLSASRHECTNYEELIADFGRDDLKDVVFYLAIRARIDRMLGERGEPEEDEEDYDDDEDDDE